MSDACLNNVEPPGPGTGTPSVSSLVSTETLTVPPKGQLKVHMSPSSCSSSFSSVWASVVKSSPTFGTQLLRWISSAEAVLTIAIKATADVATTARRFFDVMVAFLLCKGGARSLMTTIISVQDTVNQKLWDRQESDPRSCILSRTLTPADLSSPRGFAFSAFGCYMLSGMQEGKSHMPKDRRAKNALPTLTPQRSMTDLVAMVDAYHERQVKQRTSAAASN
jgi:hypothetical protein